MTPFWKQKVLKALFDCYLIMKSIFGGFKKRLSELRTHLSNKIHTTEISCFFSKTRWATSLEINTSSSKSFASLRSCLSSIIASTDMVWSFTFEFSTFFLWSNFSNEFQWEKLFTFNFWFSSRILSISGFKRGRFAFFGMFSQSLASLKFLLYPFVFVLTSQE